MKGFAVSWITACTIKCNLMVALLTASAKNGSNRVTMGLMNRHHHPHLHKFLLLVVCHCPPIVESLLQTGSCNPLLGPPRLEGGELYL